MLKRLRIEPQILWLLAFVWPFELWIQTNTFPSKGNIFTANFISRALYSMWSIGDWKAFFYQVFVDGADTGTTLVLFKQPLFAMGMGLASSDRVSVLFFATAFFVGWYLCFRFFVGAWASALGALAICCSEFIFKNLNEFDSYHAFMGMLPIAFACMGHRMALGSKKVWIAVVAAAAIFLCITLRPSEAFFITLASVILVPRLMREWPFHAGCWLGGAWWLSKPNVLMRYWGSTRGQLITLTDWDPSRLLSPITVVFLLLAISCLRSPRARQLLKRNRVLLVPVLTLSLVVPMLVAGGIVIDDYFLMVVIGLVFLSLCLVLSSEQERRRKYRTAIVALATVVFFMDQAIVIARAKPFLSLGRKMDRMDLRLRPAWIDVKKSLEADAPRTPLSASVAIVFPRPVEARRTVRPLWGTLQTLAYDDGTSVKFSFPDDSTYPEGAEADYFCRNGFTHVLVVEPQGDEIPYGPGFVVGKVYLQPDFLRPLHKLAEFGSEGSWAEQVQPAKLALYKNDCP